MQRADWNRNQYSRFFKKFIKVSKSLGNKASALSKQEFRDLYTIYSVNNSSQAMVSTTIQLTINLDRREIPAQNAETLQNPREINAFFVIISEAKIQIDCLNKVVDKFNSCS